MTRLVLNPEESRRHPAMVERLALQCCYLSNRMAFLWMKMATHWHLRCAWQANEAARLAARCHLTFSVMIWSPIVTCIEPMQAGRRLFYTPYLEHKSQGRAKLACMIQDVKAIQLEALQQPSFIIWMVMVDPRVGDRSKHITNTMGNPYMSRSIGHVGTDSTPMDCLTCTRTSGHQR